MLANPLDYIGENEDWSWFVNKVSENTGEYYERLWLNNARANKRLVKQYGWASDAFQGIHKGKTSVLLGASPAIKSQIETLKELREDPQFVFLGISSNFQYLIEKGLRPEYVMVADADPVIEKHYADTDFSKTRGITLIANVCAHNDLIKKWQGPIRFLAIYSTLKRMDKKLNKWFAPLNGCGHFFAGLMSQYNTAAAVAFTLFETSILIFVGNELSFSTEDSTYYVDRKDLKDAWERKPQIDIHGNKVYTNHMLMTLKLVLEDFLGKLSGVGWFLNCTEAGIFGVTAKHGHLPWIQQLPLKTGIAQARQIMRTGEPFYL